MSEAILEKIFVADESEAPGILDAPELSAAWPEWFRQQQRAAWEEFQGLDYPTRKFESWRFANTSRLKLDAFLPAAEAPDAAALVARSVSGLAPAARMVFANNRLLHKEGSLPEGVILDTLPETAHRHEALFRKYFMMQKVQLGSPKFVTLHLAQMTNGAFLHVPDDVVIDRPIEIYHWVSGKNASVFPHTLLVLGRNSKATVIDHYFSADNAPAFATCVNDLHLHEGANLTYLAVQEWSLGTVALHLNSTKVAQNAISRACQVHLGGSFVRGESVSRMAGDGARSEMYSIAPLSGEQELDQRTFQDHVHPNTASDLLYQNALDDKSRAIFSGLIRVEPHAHRTDAYQKVRNLLLSDEAEANSMPGLEINADEVRCTHGATSGQVNEEELFYMLARGISPREAKRLIVAGFLNTVLERLPEPAQREYLFAKIQKKLSPLKTA